MTLDLARFVIILSGSLLLGGGAVLGAHGWAQRLMLGGMLSGLAFYSGIGAASPEVDPKFIGYYFLFFVSVIFGFHIGRSFFSPVSAAIGRRLPRVLWTIDRTPVWTLVVILFLILSLFPLIWPDLRLHNLFNPPSPSLRDAFYRRFNESPDVVSKTFGYGKLLLVPFFLVAIYRLRDKIYRIAILLLLLLYVQYVEKAYIGRGDIMMSVALLWLAVWVLRPKYRKIIVVASICVLPFIIYVFYLYGRIRIGGAIASAGFVEAFASVLRTEWGFPADVGMRILETGARADIGSYFTWMATLPIPKVLTGPIEGARINYEISELVLDLPKGAAGWYVVLPGLVAESIYIYGSFWFWFHGVMLGGYAAFFVRVTERVPQFLFLYLHIVLMFSYVLNRAGISALLPSTVNELLLFYLFLLMAMFPIGADRVYRSRLCVERK